jgi:hypothetical protein
MASQSKPLNYPISLKNAVKSINNAVLQLQLAAGIQPWPWKQGRPWQQGRARQGARHAKGLGIDVGLVRIDKIDEF